MSKHTPGPWAVSTRHSESRTIHTVAGDDGPVMSTDSLPDARLIAAAPDLLAAARALEWAGGDCPVCGGRESEGHEDGCTVGDAIAKAEGSGA